MATLSQSRPNDFLYDPTFVFSGKKDYCKAAMKACMATSMFTPCPIFPSMFSTLPHRPSQQYMLRYQKKIPAHMDQSYESKMRHTKKCNTSDVALNLSKYFASPILHEEASVHIVDLNAFADLPMVTDMSTEDSVMKTVECQTQFRESSAQTSPWAPDYKIMESNDLEILKLDYLKWGSGLPAGMNEITVIERARMKRRWERELPEGKTAAELEKRNNCITALEADEWKFREQQIHDIQMLRLELLEQMLKELQEKNKDRYEKQIENLTKRKQKEKEEKVTRLHRETEREIRKLKLKHKGINMKYHELDILTEHKDFTSELYAPLLRHGEHPKRGDLIIHPDVGKERMDFENIEKFNTLPRWIYKATEIKNPKMPARTLCPRETKWSTPVLKQLHEELKNMRQQEPFRCTLRVKIIPEKPPARTPEVEGIPQYEEDLHLAMILMQSVIRGRASQMIIFEGRDTCRELIQELRSTHGLLEADKQDRVRERNNLYQNHGNEMMERNQVLQLKEALDRIQGSIIGTLMDFLNKELRRLLTERKAHSLCLMAERERMKREAAEAGRRQLEIRRRAEHDEMFKQVVKIHQETVDVYLQDIIMEGMEHISDIDARTYVLNLARKIDADAYAFDKKRPGILEQEELVADLVHHFVLPEVEKQLARTRMKMRQQKHLRNAHELIYSRMEVIPLHEGDVDRVNASISQAGVSRFNDESTLPSSEGVSIATSRAVSNLDKSPSFLEHPAEATGREDYVIAKGQVETYNVDADSQLSVSCISTIQDILQSSDHNSFVSAYNPEFRRVEEQQSIKSGGQNNEEETEGVRAVPATRSAAQSARPSTSTANENIPERMDGTENLGGSVAWKLTESVQDLEEIKLFDDLPNNRQMRPSLPEDPILIDQLQEQLLQDVFPEFNLEQSTLAHMSPEFTEENDNQAP